MNRLADMRCLGVTLCLLLTAVVVTVQAQQAAPMPGDLYKMDPKPRQTGSFYENRVEIGVESAQLFDISSKDPQYLVLPQFLAIHWQLDDIGNEGWLRGNTEFIFSGYFTPVVDGVESRYVGGLFGPRYNFVQPGWDWVPYIESRVGFGFTDSRANQRDKGQGQDFVFTFTVGIGAKYIINDQFNFSIGALYQHSSNGGLSEPSRENIGLDTIGPVFSLNYGF
ncbi:MAG: acyloxyacyl hydrolase [Verrucomicrobiota bacterium]